MGERRRRYHTTYRREQGRAQSQSTRERIAAAARRRFASDGYAATTMASIALEAGVAVQTVYAHFPSKREVLEAIMEDVRADTDLAGLERAYAAAGDWRTRLRTGMAFLRTYMERAADLDRIVRGAATAEPDLAVHRLNNEQGRKREASHAAAALRAEGALQVGMSEREAADLLYLLATPEVFEALVETCGWTSDEYEMWLEMASEALLTGSPTHPVLGREGTP